MGSRKSGNYSERPNRKTTVEECLSLDANRWAREGALQAGTRQSGTWRWTYRSGGSFEVNYTVDTLPGSPRPSVRLWYNWAWQSSGREGSADSTVPLTTTRPRFGGLRWWFLCPLAANGQPCNRRVAKLHLPPPAWYFGCRHCHRLTYTSCQKSHQFDSAWRRLARQEGMDFRQASYLFREQFCPTSHPARRETKWLRWLGLCRGPLW